MLHAVSVLHAVWMQAAPGHAIKARCELQLHCAGQPPSRSMTLQGIIMHAGQLMQLPSLAKGQYEKKVPKHAQ